MRAYEHTIIQAIPPLTQTYGRLPERHPQLQRFSKTLLSTGHRIPMAGLSQIILRNVAFLKDGHFGGTKVSHASQFRDRCRSALILPGSVLRMLGPRLTSILQAILPKSWFQKIEISMFSVSCLTSSSKTHLDILQACNDYGASHIYHRLNVAEGMADIPLDPWQKNRSYGRLRCRLHVFGGKRQSKEGCCKIPLPITPGTATNK
jgi:hypothetical protein